MEIFGPSPRAASTQPHAPEFFFSFSDLVFFSTREANQLGLFLPILEPENYAISLSFHTTIQMEF
jgi:hypothetical protein